MSDEKKEYTGINFEAVKAAAEEPVSKVENVHVEDVTASMSDVEQEAYKIGWRPEKGPKTAEEFLKDGAYIDRIKERGTQLKKKDKQIESLTNYVKSLSENIEKIKENAYKQALEKLETEKEIAIAIGDSDAVQKANTQIEEAKKEHSKASHPAAVDFAAKYGALMNPDLSTIEPVQISEAIGISEFILRTDKVLSLRKLDPDKHMEVLEDTLLKVYKDSPLLKDYLPTVEPEDENETVVIKNVSNAVEPASNGGKSVKKKTYTVNDLSAAQRTMMNDLVRAGLTTQEKFIANQALAGNIGKF